MLLLQRPSPSERTYNGPPSAYHPGWQIGQKQYCHCLQGMQQQKEIPPAYRMGRIPYKPLIPEES
jgi:hypothetical protein